MDLALWIAAASLALIALVGGVTKTLVPKETIARHRGGEWTDSVSARSVRTLGVLELLAAVGLILPAVTDVAPWLVAFTAVCWMALMIGAMATHGRLGQYGFVVVNVVYLGIAAFIFWGRIGPEPFTS